MNIEKITFLIGSPGSGKSTLGNKLLSSNPTQTVFYDDMGILVNNSEYQDPVSYIKNNIDDNIKFIIISDVYFCFTDVRQKATEILKKAFNCPIETFYFENNLNKCLSNIKYRQANGDKREVSELAIALSKEYNIPSHIVPLPIFQTSDLNNNIIKNKKLKT